MKKHSLLYLALFVSFVVLSSTAAIACTAPATAGVKICSPGTGESVAYPAHITAAATAPAGRHITAIAVYANSTQTQFLRGESHVDDLAYSIKPGKYMLSVNAWDDAGQVYVTRTSLTVAGGQTTGCVPPAAGVLFCSPENGSLQPTNDVTGSVGARGANGSPITRMQVFIDTFLMQDGAQSNFQFSAGFGNAGTHTLSAKAWDAAGNVYSATTKFKTYFDGICSPKGCAPGVFVQSPADGSTVSSSFRVQADVENTTATITTMKAYLDGREVASSSGPTMLANIDAPAGKHTLILQAWDTQGRLYRTTEHITVQ